MTRILSLGQNQGVTVMILNLAPLRSYHLDTLSSLNFANRTKKIEVNEIENLPVYSSTTSLSAIPSNRPALSGSNITRQPLRPLNSTTHNITLPDSQDRQKPPTNNLKPIKAFSVYADPRKPNSSASRAPLSSAARDSLTSANRPSASKPFRPSTTHRPTTKPSTQQHSQALSAASIEALIDRKLDAKLAERALRTATNDSSAVAQLPAAMQARLDALEQRVAEKEDSDGLHFLLMAKQHAARGEEGSALRMYKLALPFYPGNGKLLAKIRALEEKVVARREGEKEKAVGPLTAVSLKKRTVEVDDDDEYRDEAEDDRFAGHQDDDDEYVSDDGFRFKAKAKKQASSNKKAKLSVFRDESEAAVLHAEQTPRTRQLIHIINSRDVSQIKTLKGVGAKKAEAIVGCLVDMADDEIVDLEQLGALKGVGWKGVENMRTGLVV